MAEERRNVNHKQGKHGRTGEQIKQEETEKGNCHKANAATNDYSNSCIHHTSFKIGPGSYSVTETQVDQYFAGL